MGRLSKSGAREPGHFYNGAKKRKLGGNNIPFVIRAVAASHAPPGFRPGHRGRLRRRLQGMVAEKLAAFGFDSFCGVY